jgi:rhombotail lipoprotein
MSACAKCLALLLVAFGVVSGCWWQQSRQGVSSSLVDFLYPQGQRPPPQPTTVPHLDLPVRVGLAFVPSRDATVEGLSEAHRAALLDQVKRAFADRDFISQIEVIPDTYLRSSRGFETVDQVARLYHLDVIALVSYDQVAVTGDNKASITYWTIIGAYLVPGTQHEVQTFVDTAVFDVRTHELLFRAPGISTEKATSTLVNSAEVSREQSAKSFNLAMQDMTVNLTKELDLFRERVKNEHVITVSSNGKAGSTDAFFVLLVVGLTALATRARVK